MSELKKNQHYVPRGFLQRFSTPKTDKKKVVVYNIERDKIEQHKSISNILKEDFFYDSEIDPFISAKFGIQGTENTLAAIEHYMLNKLRIIETNLSFGKPLNDDDAYDLAYFLYLSYTRTKKFREVLFKPVEFDLTLKAQHALGLSQPEIYHRAVSMFRGRNYVLAEAARGLHFVTSDSPVAFVPNINLDSEDTEKTNSLFNDVFLNRPLEEKGGLDFVFPISRYRALVGVDPQTTKIQLMNNQTSVKLDRTQTYNIIGAISFNAYNYIIGSDKSDVEKAVEVRKWKVDEINNRTEEQKRRIQSVLYGQQSE